MRAKIMIGIVLFLSCVVVNSVIVFVANKTLSSFGPWLTGIVLFLCGAVANFGMVFVVRKVFGSLVPWLVGAIIVALSLGGVVVIKCVLCKF